jgi:hypothetical protein
MQALMAIAKYLIFQDKTGGGGGNRTRVRVGLNDRVYVRSSGFRFGGRLNPGAGSAGRESGLVLVRGSPTRRWTSLLG